MGTLADHGTGKLDPDRARGALLGLAVGDALGTTLEFMRVPPLPFEPLLSGPHKTIVGAGPFGLVAGQVTDDTQMATALARALMTEGGFDVGAVAAGYVAWSRHAFDIGNQTSQTLSRIAGGGDPRMVGREVWLDSGKSIAGNGSLMRTVPLAVYYAEDERRLASTLAESAITHYDPRCQLACAAYNAAIAAALTHRNTVAEMLTAADAELARAHALCLANGPDDKAEIDKALGQLRADLAAARNDDPDLYGDEVHLGRMAGFVRVAFRLAFWHLVHTASFDAALIDTANRGGDADTNGAIVGALLGAHLGASAIPTAWVELVRGALAGGDGPWATTYHPRELLALLHTD